VNSNTGEPRQRIIAYNDYSFELEQPGFKMEQIFRPTYLEHVKYLVNRDNVDVSYKDGYQKNFFSNYPYLPIRLDARYGMPTSTPLQDNEKDEVMGRDALPTNYTSTGVLGQMGLKALDRMIARYEQDRNPFALSVHFNAPHPPMVATYDFFDYYFDNRDQLYTPASIDDDMSNSFYWDAGGRKQIENGGGFNRPTFMKEMTAAYYAMIEEGEYFCLHAK